jgi:predicted 3-demethylubiquinone-9 3-methyltransferase (glyoxalase superfamily)
MLQKITPFLWFDTQAEEAANFYVSIFKNSRVDNVTPYVTQFQLEGIDFMALNGGPMFKFTEAVSFMVHCEGQEEVDYFWNSLTAGGTESQCGWLKDKFGLSWQIVPTVLGKLLSGPDPEGAGRAMKAMMGMAKLDIAELERAHEGN